LAALGGLAGLAIARQAVSVLRQLGRDALPRLDEVGIDPVVLGFAAALTGATAVAFGIAPTLRLARVDPNRSLGQHSRSTTSSHVQGRIRIGLAMAQLGLALTLLTGAGVLLASFHRLQQVDLGVRVHRILTFNLSLPTARYDAARRAALQEELVRRIESIPGVTRASGTSRLPATGEFHSWPTVIESGPLVGTTVPQPLQPQHRTVSGHFFDVFQIPTLAGRVFDEHEDTGTPGRAVVSASFARQFYPGLSFERVVGQRFRFLGNRRREIIGVVGDVVLDVYGTPAHHIYHAHRQFADDRNWALTGAVATDVPPEQILPAVRAQVGSLDPELAVYRTAAMSEVLGRGASRQRFALILIGVFAVVALMLAGLGLYGVLAYTVRQRTQEIGIRIALGATTSQVRALVLRQMTLVLAVGLAVGTGGALALGRWLSSLAFQVSPSDPRILGATALLLALTGLLAA
jgi:predicted permease